MTAPRRSAGALVAALALQAAPMTMPMETRAQAGSPFRYDDDVSQYVSPGARVNLYDDLKYVPLGDATGEYLSFGGDLRERVEVNSNALLGYRNKGPNAYDLHRRLLFADVHYDGFQVFVQLGNETEAGRAPGPLPTDIDRGDLAQGFIGYAFAAGPGNATILRLQHAITSADAVLIATPEYNYSVPGALKNAIDWVSRTAPQPFANKPVAIMGASPDAFGTARAQYDLRKIFVYLDAHLLNKPEVMISAAHTRFDADGRLTDHATREFLTGFLTALRDWTHRLQARA